MTFISFTDADAAGLNVYLAKFSCRAAPHTAMETNVTTVTELSGINIAAMIGVKFPLTAKASPTTL